MSRVLVEKKVLEDIKKTSPIGGGFESKCYRYQNNQIIKIFSIPKTNILFDDIEEERIAFPKEIWFDKDSNRLVGYTMNFLNGEDLTLGFKKNLSLEELKQVYLNTKELFEKYKFIYMRDINLKNLLYDYDKNQINIIDTSFWYKGLGGNSYSIDLFNYQMINALLLNIVNLKKILEENKNLNNLFIAYQNYSHKINNLHISNLFYEFLKELEL